MSMTKIHPAILLSAVASIVLLTLFFTPREQLQRLSPCTVISASPSTSDLALRLERSETLWAESVRAREEFIRERGIGNLALLGEGGGTYSVWDIYYAAYNCPWTDERIGRVGKFDWRISQYPCSPSRYAPGDGGKWICGLETLQGRGRDAVIYSIGELIPRRQAAHFTHSASFLAATRCGERVVLRSDRPRSIPLRQHLRLRKSTFLPLSQITTHPRLATQDLSVDSWGPQILASEKYNSQAHFTKAGISAHDEPHKTPPNYSLKSLMKINGHHVSTTY